MVVEVLDAMTVTIHRPVEDVLTTDI